MNFFKLNKKQKYWLDFLFTMTEKDVRVRYGKTGLGFFWMIINPLLQMGVIGFVFQFVTKTSVNNYFIFLLTGLIPWNFFSMTIIRSSLIYIAERNLIQKSKFPLEIIIFSVVMSSAFHFFINVMLFFLIVFLWGNLSIFNLWLFFIALIWLLLLASGFALLFSSLNVLIRDVNFIVQAIVPLWFYLTPIFYNLDLIPVIYRFLFYLNPMTGVIELFHSAFLLEPIRNANYLFLSIGISLCVIVTGIYCFKKISRLFVDLL